MGKQESDVWVHPKAYKEVLENYSITISKQITKWREEYTLKYDISKKLSIEDYVNKRWVW